MQNKLLFEAYRRNAVAVITQILTDAGISAVASTTLVGCKAPIEVLGQEKPIGAVVCMWDLYLGHIQTGKPIGWLRFEFGPVLEISSNIKSLKNVEGVIHRQWMELPKAPALVKDTIHFTHWVPGNHHAN